MKTAYVVVKRTNEERETVTAYITDTPGLVVHRVLGYRRELTRPRQRSWVVTHAESGLRLPGQFRTRAGALRAAEGVNVYDWTGDAESCKGFAAAWAYHRAQNATV